MPTIDGFSRSQGSPERFDGSLLPTRARKLLSDIQLRHTSGARCVILTPLWVYTAYVLQVTTVCGSGIFYLYFVLRHRSLKSIILQMFLILVRYFANCRASSRTCRAYDPTIDSINRALLAILFAQASEQLAEEDHLLHTALRHEIAIVSRDQVIFGRISHPRPNLADLDKRKLGNRARGSRF